MTPRMTGGTSTAASPGLRLLRTPRAAYCSTTHVRVTSCDDRESFIREAIGLALRKFTKTDPDRIASYVTMYRRDVSGLTLWEATERLEEQWQVEQR